MRDLARLWVPVRVRDEPHARLLAFAAADVDVGDQALGSLAPPGFLDELPKAALRGRPHTRNDDMSKWGSSVTPGSDSVNRRACCTSLTAPG